MKKVITYTTLCLIVILVLPSCRTRMGITKRHYTKGYYISSNIGKDRITASKAQIKKVEIKKLEPINVSKIKTDSGSINEQSGHQPNEGIMASATPESTSNIYTNKRERYKNTIIRDQLNVAKKTIQPGNAGDRGGLSLFWIIILVILIFWLFGFLSGGFGLGVLFNILLVVALILLILWLLRIV